MEFPCHFSSLAIKPCPKLILQGKNLEHLKIPFIYIQSATDSFSDTYMIENRDGCTFYKAQLDYYDKENHSSEKHNFVIIKRYPSGGHRLYGKKEFLIEIEILSSVKHPNIGTLLGFCLEASEMILIIGNFYNGLLGLYFENPKYLRVLTWEKTFKNLH
ncbi:putative protein kinase RLK-Pelle-LRR-Xb-1 family [Helianthus annuus]|nr:putative protein kinase RLK-Pelle-LRR-Xb-1 family [Helianthus annuus]